MKRSREILTLVLLIAASQLPACAKQTEAAQESSPVQVEHLNGKEVSRVTLTADAAKRLDIQTDAAQIEKVGTVERIVVPYSSILYDTDGHTWVYVSPDPLTYLRSPVEVDSIQGDDAFLVAGPEAGMAVVTVGAEELFGSETEFEEE